MMASSDVSLNVAMTCPTSGGIDTRSDWGSTMKPVRWVVVSPTASAASYCPRRIDCSPPRTFSARYAAENKV